MCFDTRSVSVPQAFIIRINLLIWVKLTGIFVCVSSSDFFLVLGYVGPLVNCGSKTQTDQARTFLASEQLGVLPSWSVPLFENWCLFSRFTFPLLSKSAISHYFY